MSEASELLLEGQELVETFSRLLFDIEDRLREGEELDPDQLNESFRSIHTLKGLAGLAGSEPLKRFAHEIESSLDALRLGKARLDTELLNLLFEATNAFEQLLLGANVDTASLLTKLARRLDSSSASAEVGLEWLDPSILGVLSEFEEHRLRENLRLGRRIFQVNVEFDLLSLGDGIEVLKTKLKQHGEVISFLPSADGVDADRMGFAVLVGSTAAQADLLASVTDQGGTVDCLTGEVAPPKPPPSSDEAGDDHEPELDPGLDSSRGSSHTVRVDLRRLDLLMNLVGELGLVHANLDGTVERLREDPSADLQRELLSQLRTMSRRVAQLQQGILDVRMVPIKQTFERVQRLVKRTAREQNKQMRLHITGTETELDKQIGEQLSKPLVHMINNAIAHGIEGPAERERIGKHPVGRINLDAYQQGNRVIIEVRDDGRGIDWRAIRDKALQKGFISRQEAAEIDPVRAINLIFLHGFSSKDEADTGSGRGVGMDVVKTEIAKLSGMIDVATEPGKGTRFRVTLPSTMAIVQALVVQSAGQTFCIQLNSVLESLMVGTRDIQTIEGCKVISVRGRTLPLLSLAEVFELELDADARTSTQLYVVVVGLAEHRVGLIVDELLGQRDVVIKPLGRALRQIPGIAGATELGDHRTVLLLDVAPLVSEAVGGDAMLAGSTAVGTDRIRVSTKL
jgi:two-component system, chemotaxis family, sensor kinase CheA